MANLVVAMLMLATVISTVVALTQAALAPQSDLSDSWKEMRLRTGERSRTKLSSRGVTVLPSNEDLEFTVRNDGQTALRGFDTWDVFVTYEPSATGTSLRLLRLDYTSAATPGADQWTVKDIYMDAATADPEVFGPGIVDSGEEFVVRARVSAPIASPTNNQITLAVANGVTLSAQFAN